MFYEVSTYFVQVYEKLTLGSYRLLCSNCILMYNQHLSFGVTSQLVMIVGVYTLYSKVTIPNFDLIIKIDLNKFLPKIYTTYS